MEVVHVVFLANMIILVPGVVQEFFVEMVPRVLGDHEY